MVTQEVRPVLVRNLHNRLFKLTVTCQQPYVVVDGLTVSLSGTDDRKDIDVIEVFRGSDFNPLVRYGDRVAVAGKRVKIAGHAIKARAIKARTAGAAAGGTRSTSSGGIGRTDRADRTGRRCTRGLGLPERRR